MILIGILMLSGKMNDVTGYLASLTQTENAKEPEDESEDKQKDTKKDTETSPKEPEDIQEESQTQGESENTPEESEKMPALGFELKDQYGNVHTLEDYKGKTIFLNFWATWCPPCKEEMPDIQKIHETYDKEGKEALIVLGVAAPNYGREGSKEDIKAFLESNGYTYPVLMDEEGALLEAYQIYSYPTTFMIDRDGNVFGYVSGMLTEEMMNSIIRQTLDGKMN